MDQSLIGYSLVMDGSEKSSIFLKATILLAGLTMSVGLIAGCGSDGSDSTGSGGPGYQSGPAEAAVTGDSGEVTPDAKKPASAGDKKKNAPDRAISKRPGGPESEPTSP